MAVNIIVGEGLLHEKAGWGVGQGVYIIMFDTGHYYIGSSVHLNWRIRTHMSAIKSNFTTKATCKALTLMRGFEGTVHIRLIQSTDGEKNRRELLDLENSIIETHAGDDFMLNFVPVPIVLPAA